MEVSDAQLFESWVGGERASGAKLFDRHFAALSRFFANKAGDGADDLIQKTFLALVENADTFRGSSSVRTFIFAIARNVLYNHYRSKRRERLEFNAQSTAQRELNPDLDPTPSAWLADKREHRQLLEALRSIPVESQLILELVYWERLKARELAEILGVPEGTARTRLRRARQLCAQALSNGRGGADLETTLTRLDDWAAGLRVQWQPAADSGP